MWTVRKNMAVIEDCACRVKKKSQVQSVTAGKWVGQDVTPPGRREIQEGAVVCLGNTWPYSTQ